MVRAAVIWPPSTRRNATQFAAAGRALEAPVATGLPTIIATSLVPGYLLAGLPGTWRAYPTPNYTYRWRRDGIVIDGQTSINYVIRPEDVGKVISISVTAKNSSGEATATSLPTAPIAEALSAPAVINAPAISGIAKQGETLTLVAGTFSGNPIPGLSRQWMRNGAAIPGAIGTSYVLTAADVGAQITITVTATNSQGFFPATSAATVAVVGLESEPTPSTAGTPIGLLLTLTSSGQPGEVGTEPPPETGGGTATAGTPVGLLLTITKGQ